MYNWSYRLIETRVILNCALLCFWQIFSKAGPLGQRVYRGGWCSRQTKSPTLGFILILFLILILIEIAQSASPI
jgi:hypothetical protein